MSINNIVYFFKKNQLFKKNQQKQSFPNYRLLIKKESEQFFSIVQTLLT